MELSVVMPCLNEAETVASCVSKAVRFIAESGIDGEVIIADNGSTDGSQQLAAEAGAQVVPVGERGYGSALIGGIAAARGEYVIMGDADDSYDFNSLMPFVTELRNGADLVMGNRFQGGIDPGAMPPLHRYLGNPVLSFMGRLFFRSQIGDFHCGLRGFRRDSVLDLSLHAAGMEFASEMVVKATLAQQKIAQVPTRLAKDGRSRPPHLRTWRDGWRHLRFLLMYSPRWLFFVPGAAMILLGLIIGGATATGPITIGDVTFDVDTLVAAGGMVIIGFQSVLFWLFSRVYARSEGFLPDSPRAERVLASFSLERVLLLGGVIGLAGLAGLIFALIDWQANGFGRLNYEHALRVMVPAVTALTLSCQAVLGGFFLSILCINQTRRATISPTAAADATLLVPLCKKSSDMGIRRHRNGVNDRGGGQQRMKVLITGGAGFIGSTVASACLDAGICPVILDNLVAGRREFAAGRAFYEGDVADGLLIDRIFADHPDIYAVIHCAALIVVPDSVVNPVSYYQVNVAKSLELVGHLLRNGCSRLIFSSSAAIYRADDDLTVDENSLIDPQSPYARTKAVCEGMFADIAASLPIRVLSLRYFNPIGADPKMRTGLQLARPTHALGQMIRAHEDGAPFVITGTDWPTRDGTGLRDYVHVWDLAEAHVAALTRFDILSGPVTVINLGTGTGTTVRELVESFNQVAEHPIQVQETGRRPGDQAGAYSRVDRAERLLGWRAERDIAEGIRHSLQWAALRAEILSGGVDSLVQS